MTEWLDAAHDDQLYCSVVSLGEILALLRTLPKPSKLSFMAENPAFDRTTVEPGKGGGKPCIRGMRITVRRVLEILATYRDRGEIFREYPYLEEEDLRQALRYAAAG